VLTLRRHGPMTNGDLNEYQATKEECSVLNIVTKYNAVYSVFMAPFTDSECGQTPVNSGIVGTMLNRKVEKTINRQQQS